MAACRIAPISLPFRSRPSKLNPISCESIITISPSCVTRSTGRRLCFRPTNHKLRRRAIGVIRKLDRHMTRVTKHFVVTFPFAFEFLRDWRVPRRILNLGRSCFLQRYQCAISGLLNCRPTCCSRRAAASSVEFRARLSRQNLHRAVAL